MAQDSPLSIATSVIGILTFAVAVLLGFYTRAIQLGQGIDRLIRLDDEIIEWAHLSVKSLFETRKSEENAKSFESSRQDEVKELFVRMYFLDLKAIISTISLLNQSIATKVTKASEWENNKEELRKDRLEVEKLRSRLYSNELLKLLK